MASWLFRSGFPESFVVEFLVFDGDVGSEFVHSIGFLSHERFDVSSVFRRVAGWPDEFACYPWVSVAVGAFDDEAA